MSSPLRATDLIAIFVSAALNRKMSLFSINSNKLSTVLGLGLSITEKKIRFLSLIQVLQWTVVPEMDFQINVKIKFLSVYIKTNAKRNGITEVGGGEDWEPPP